MQEKHTQIVHREKTAGSENSFSGKNEFKFRLCVGSSYTPKPIPEGSLDYVCVGVLYLIHATLAFEY